MHSDALVLEYRRQLRTLARHWPKDWLLEPGEHCSECRDGWPCDEFLRVLGPWLDEMKERDSG